MNLNRIILNALFTMILIVSSFGCNRTNSGSLDKGIERFETGEVAKASEDFLAAVNNDSTDIRARIKLISAGAYLNSDYRVFYSNAKKLEQLSPDFQNLFNYGAEINTNWALEKMVKSAEQTMGRQVINKYIKDEIQDVSSAINKNPKNPYFYFVRGIWNGQFFNYDGADKDFTTAIELKKDFWQAYYLRGIFSCAPNNYSSYSDFKKQLRTINDLKHVLAINPGASEVYSNLYRINQNYGNENEALECLDNIYKHDTTKTIILAKKAEIEVNNGNHAAAVEDYKTLLKREPDNIAYLYYLAKETIATGKKQEGINLLKKALAQCRNKHWENKIINAIDNETNQTKSKNISLKKDNNDEFIKLYMAAQEKLKDGKREEGIALLKKAEPLATSRYYKDRISSFLRDKPRKIEREENAKGVREKRIKEYKEIHYLRGKKYIENKKYELGIKELRNARTRTHNEEILNEINIMIEAAEWKSKTSLKIEKKEEYNKNKRDKSNYSEHYYVTGKRKLAEGKTKEGIEDLKTADRICSSHEIKKEIKELIKNAGKK